MPPSSPLRHLGALLAQDGDEWPDAAMDVAARAEFSPSIAYTLLSLFINRTLTAEQHGERAEEGSKHGVP